MGIMEQSKGSLADALFTRGQQRVLGILFLEPDRSFSATELITRAQVGTGAVHRELTRLVESGLVTVTPVGRQRRYQASRDSPVFHELRGLVVKTVGLAEPLRRALRPLAGQILVAFLYGSVARGSDTARSDIDLLIVSDGLSYPDVYGALREAEEALARSVNPTILTVGKWREGLERKDHFIESLRSQPRLYLIGADDDLA